MGELLEFIIDNFYSILLVTIIMITLLVSLNMLNPNLYEDSPEKISKIVTIETLKNNYSDLPNLTFDKNNFQISKKKSDIDDFSLISFNKNSYCKNNLSSPTKMHKFCCANNQKNLCISNSCCGWLNKERCVGGDKEGPYFMGTENNPLIINSYNHMGKSMNY